MNHIYKEEQFGEDWFSGVESLYSSFVERMSNGSVFVEVGCWKGKSIAYIAVEIANSGKNIKCYAVDTWKGSPEHQTDPLLYDDGLYKLFVDNISPIQQYITPVRKSSIDAAKDFEDKSVDIVYIDANHDYEEVKKDIVNWLPKIKNGGIISGHDYCQHWSGVVRAVDEIFPNGVVVHNGTAWSYQL